MEFMAPIKLSTFQPVWHTSSSVNVGQVSLRVSRRLDRETAIGAAGLYQQWSRGDESVEISNIGVPVDARQKL